MNQEIKLSEKIEIQLFAIEQSSRLAYPETIISLDRGALKAAEIPLLVYGIIGGKDVGKSTLLNSLLEKEVSVEDIPGHLAEGTKYPVAYFHKDDDAVFSKWIRDRELNKDEYKSVMHDNETLRNVVFIDLPDFDSNFKNHLVICNKLITKLDRMICVSVIGKELDRDLQTLIVKANRSDQSWLMLLNKYDQIPKLKDHPIDKLKPTLLKNFQDMGLSALVSNDIFIISAVNTAEFEFPELRERLIRVHRTEEIDKHKRHEMILQVKGEILALEKRLNWNKDYGILDQLINNLSENLKVLFSDEEIQKAERRLKSSGGPQRWAADELLLKKTEQIAFLSFFSPIASLVSWIGGHLVFKSDGKKGTLFERIFTFNGKNPKDRLIEMLYEQSSSEANIEKKFGKDFSLFNEGSIEAAYEELQNGLEQHLRIDLDNFIETRKKPSFLMRWSPLFLALWFVVFQPVLERLLGIMVNEGGVFKSGLVILYEMVQVLSPIFVLEVLGVIVVTFILFIVMLYASCARQVSAYTMMAIRNWWMDDNTAKLLTTKTLAPSIEKHGQLKLLKKQSDELKGLLHSKFD